MMRALLLPLLPLCVAAQSAAEQLDNMAGGPSPGEDSFNSCLCDYISVTVRFPKTDRGRDLEIDCSAEGLGFQISSLVRNIIKDCDAEL